ncbi:MAG: hypothetical protein ACYCZX_12490 [Rhodospirillaceae bacterium]
MQKIVAFGAIIGFFVSLTFLAGLYLHAQTLHAALAACSQSTAQISGGGVAAGAEAR